MDIINDQKKCMASLAVFNVMSNDTLFVSSCPSNRAKYISAGGLLFRVAGTGVFGEWSLKNKKLKPLLSKERLRELNEIRNNETSPIDPYYQFFLNYSY